MFVDRQFFNDVLQGVDGFGCEGRIEDAHMYHDAPDNTHDPVCGLYRWLKAIE
jgi:hypothetical protein